MPLLVAAILSVAIGIVLGLLGGGVSTLTLPMLVYVLGVAPQPAAAASLFVVCVTSVTGALAQARAGRVVWRVGAVFAIGGVLGAYGGALLARVLSPRALLSAFGIEMVVAAVAMMRGRGAEPPRRAARRDLSISRSVVVGAAIGTVSGLVGAGGGFLVVPALETVCGLGLWEAIGTSPLVSALQAVAGIAGRFHHVSLDWRLVGLLTLSTTIGCLGGITAARHVSPGALRRGFACMVLGVALFVLARQVAGLDTVARGEIEARPARV